MSSQTHVCSVNACHPSLSSRRNPGMVAVRTAAGKTIPASSDALVAYVAPSSRSAQPEPIVATSAPPTAAPSTFAE